MDWVKLHTRFYVDPKVASLPDADTEMMFVRSLAYAGDQETGGFIPESATGLLARRRRHTACVNVLVGAGLWTRVNGGYRITRWDDRQEELEMLARRRAVDRERKRRKRAAERSSSTPMSADASAECPRDVRALELEGELEIVKPKGGENSRAAPSPSAPPPRRCPAHQHHDGPVPPCGACADARRAFDAWQAHHPPPPAPGPLAPAQQAARARAEQGTQQVRETAQIDPDPELNVARVADIRDAMGRREAAT